MARKVWPKLSQGEAVRQLVTRHVPAAVVPTVTPLKPLCTDCRSDRRKLLQVSPKVLLCATCIRERRNAKRLKGRETRQKRSFGITVAEGDAITRLQGGGCICMKWTGYNGKSRALSTDHDHATGLIRGKLCKHCNDLLGRVRDDPAYFIAMIAYLKAPPAVAVLGERYVPEGG